MVRDLAEFQEMAVARGFTHDFGSSDDSLSESDAGDLRIVDSASFDSGTDPGDDVTVYLIEARGQNGYLIVSDSFHVDPVRAAFLDALLAGNDRD